MKCNNLVEELQPICEPVQNYETISCEEITRKINSTTDCWFMYFAVFTGKFSI